MLQRLFKLHENGTNVSKEVLAGLTTFFTMAYILVVAPAILSQGGIDGGGVFVGTCLAAALGSLLVGLMANYPIAMAPGLGLLSFFSYILIKEGYTWQEGLGIVSVSGLVFFIITITKIRQYILEAIPQGLGCATAAGIGFFIAFIAMKNIDFVVTNSATLVTLGNIHTKACILCIVGFFLIVILGQRNIIGALLIGMAVVSCLGWFWGMYTLPSHLLSLPPNPAAAFMHAEFHGLWHLSVLALIFTFLMVALFDSTGSLIGLTMHLPHKNKADQIKRINRALVAESITTMVSGGLGVTTSAPFIESAAGIKSGGRTGMTALVIAVCFLLALFLAPLAMSVPNYATSAALFYVGCLMVKPVAGINWDDMVEAIPAAIILLAIPLTFSIVDGVGLGVVTYTILMLSARRAKKVHPMLYVLAAAFIVYFAL